MTSHTLLTSDKKGQGMVWWLPRKGRLLILLTGVAVLSAACVDGGEAATSGDVTNTSAADTESEAPLVSSEAGTVGFQDFSEGTEKSFGIFVCATDADVVIDSVEAMSSDGDIELIGAILYEAEDGFVGAIHDFPPRGLNEEFFTDIPGATVATPCDSETRTQVVVGASRTGSGGGLIEGIRINYRGGSLDVADYRIILCGDEGEFCDVIDSLADPGTAGT